MRSVINEKRFLSSLAEIVAWRGGTCRLPGVPHLPFSSPLSSLGSLGHPSVAEPLCSPHPLPSNWRDSQFRIGQGETQSPPLRGQTLMANRPVLCSSPSVSFELELVLLLVPLILGLKHILEGLPSENGIQNRGYS